MRVLVTDHELDRLVKAHVDNARDDVVNDTVQAFALAVTDVLWGFCTVEEALAKVDRPFLGGKIPSSARNTVRYVLVDIAARRPK